MNSAEASYPLPQALEPDLGKLHAFWQDLLRAESTMPFSDDVNISHIPDLANRILLLNVFENPQRFRFEAAGEAVSRRYGAPLNGEFSDELESRAPLEELTGQCSATVMQRRPTYYRSAGYARLLLPTWGDGHVMMLLGAVADLQG